MSVAYAEITAFFGGAKLTQNMRVGDQIQFKDWTPYPLSGKSFCQETLSKNGGNPPSPIDGKSAKLSGISFTEVENYFFVK